jgi:HKD family nuclease
MDLLLHAPNIDGKLSHYYKRAFKKAVELFVVTAYLTEWDSSLELNSECRSFRVIVGRDFGITRKAACEKVMRWLPPKRKAQFMVADRIGGFHPKAVFWKEEKGNCFAIVGSSNLTQAAFGTNYEANVFFPLSGADYVRGKKWVEHIEKQAVVVSEDWLKKYKEALPTQQQRAKGREQDATPVIELKLPRPPGMKVRIGRRRGNLAAYKNKQAALIGLFRRCASKEISSKQFYKELPKYWSFKVGDRLQGRGWERQGRDTDFHALSQSFMRVLDATDADRDNVVSSEIDWLSRQKVPTRRAFLSEMLCLRFPDEYPVLNQPVQDYLKAVKYKATRGASEGARFLHLAKALRSSLLQNPNHPAKNLAELDTLIWLAYGKKNDGGLQ